MNDEEEEKKEVTIVTGDSSDLNISQVDDHIIMDKPEKKDDKQKNIIIPKSNKNN